MKIKEIIGIILMLPLWILVIASFVASIYAALKNIAGITWSSPIIIGGCIVFYCWGRYLSRNIKEVNKNVAL